MYNYDTTVGQDTVASVVVKICSSHAYGGSDESAHSHSIDHPSISQIYCN